QSGVTMGTPLYMSPEQVEGKPVDPRTDIYSFGVTCYHVLAGEPPFRGETAFEVALKHVREQVVPLAEVRPDLPPALCAVVERMMAKDPAQRFQSCRDLLKELGQLQEGLRGPGNGPFEVPPIPDVSTSLPVPRRRLPAVRLRWQATLALSVLAALVLGTI